MIKRICVVILVLSLSGFAAGCGDNFLEGGVLSSNPNIADKVTPEAIFVAMQPNAYIMFESTNAFYIQMWMQQMAGITQMFVGYDIFEVAPGDFGWGAWYQGQGLIDIQAAVADAKEAGKNQLAAVITIWKVLEFAFATELFGDIPYSEAGRPDEITNPKLDKQSDVIAMLHQELDEAISTLQGGNLGYFESNKDFSFYGDKDKWIRAAHTLKARMYINWAEVDASNYQKALAEAQMGIQSFDGSWCADHEDAPGQWAIYHEFQTKRGDYVLAGKYLVDMLKADNDARLEVYFSENTEGDIVGSASGEYNGNASYLNWNLHGGADWDAEFVTYEENQFIIAEAQYFMGDEDAAVATLDAILTEIEQDKWGLALNSMPRYSDRGLSGIDLLEAIMLEKYKALFLNVQVWSDWRRTAFPILEVYADRLIPRRFLYPEIEINTNPNIPMVTLWDRLENDPGNPDYSASGRIVNP